MTTLPAITLDLMDEKALSNLVAYSKDAEGAFSEATAKAVANDLRKFMSWCDATGHSAKLPVEPRTVAAFVDAMAEVMKPATVKRYVASLNHLHRGAGLAVPGSAEVVRLAVKRMNRAKGVSQDQAQALRREDVDRIIEAIPVHPGRELLAYRDAALIALAYDTMARQSELAALNAGDLAPMEDGSGALLIGRSKTDQEGEGAHVYVAPDTMVHVAVWMQAANKAGKMPGPDAPMFIPLGPTAQADRLDSADVARIMKRRAKDAGIEDAGIGGHSTRVGAAQDMRAAGLGTGDIAQAGRWKSEAMVHRYTAKLGARDGAAAKLAAMQGRQTR